MSRRHDIVRGLIATLSLATLSLATPVLLWNWRHNPLPKRLPSWDRVTTLVRAGYIDAAVIPNTLAALTWAAWTAFIAALLIDLTGRARPIRRQGGTARRDGAVELGGPLSSAVRRSRRAH